MPLFEYTCRGCELSFEELVSSSNPSPQISCPRCHGDRVERQLSTFASPGISTGGSRGFEVAAGGGGGCGNCGCNRC